MRSPVRKMMCALLAGSVGMTATVAGASSHREAPAIAGMPRLDSTDVYFFRSYEPGRQDFVTFIANYIPLQPNYSGPNFTTFDRDALYEIHFDSNGDAAEDLTFQFRFDTQLSGTAQNPNRGIELNVGGQNVAIALRAGGQIGPGVGQGAIGETESYRINVVRGDRRRGQSAPVTAQGGGTTFVKPIDNIGNKTIPNYEAYADAHIRSIVVPGCSTPGRVFVGQRAENFGINIGEIFDLVNLVPIQGVDNPDFPQYNVGNANAFPGGIVQSFDNDDIVGEFNVTSIALELPISCLVGNGNGVVGAWTTASLPQARLLDPTAAYNGLTRQGGPFVQVSRLSAPLVNELVIGLRDKDLYSGAPPRRDGQFATYVTNPTLPALIDILFRDAVNTTLGANIPNLAPSNFPRNDLVAAFLTGFPGLNQQARVTPSEMLRLNTAIPPTPLAQQNVFGVVAEDLAGFPNGRRPTDDAVDLALRVVMGALCHPLPLGAELGVQGAVEDTPTDLVNLGLCTPSQAPVGAVALTDGAPLRPTDLINRFPYLNTPIPGSPNPRPDFRLSGG
jgi:hypothetical protein